MKRTVDEKYNYNKSKGGDFGDGYCIGVNIYRRYFKLDTERRQETKVLINNFMSTAKKGDQLSKGIIAGYRDAANDRKERSTRLS